MRNSPGVSAHQRAVDIAREAERRRVFDIAIRHIMAVIRKQRGRSASASKLNMLGLAALRAGLRTAPFCRASLSRSAPTRRTDEESRSTTAGRGVMTVRQ